MAKALQAYHDPFHWVCDNENKLGKDIYGVKMQHCNDIPGFENPQIIVVVTSPADKESIRIQLASWGKRPVEDFWFFA